MSSRTPAVGVRAAPLRLFFGPALVAAVVLADPGLAHAGILGATNYAIDLTRPKEAARKARWSDPKLVRVGGGGLGWGKATEPGTRDFWLETTEPIGLGVSWRPPMTVSVRAAVEGPAPSGQLYVRYSPDAKHWSTWQVLKEAGPVKAGDAVQRFEGEVRVPYREMARYQELRMKYARRDDVAWASDEEALVKDILKKDPKFFAKNLPFIGYVQFLYEAQLPGGHRLKGLKFELPWAVGGMHRPPKDPTAERNRGGPWRFRAR